jgi:hypothetical protein
MTLIKYTVISARGGDYRTHIASGKERPPMHKLLMIGNEARIRANYIKKRVTIGESRYEKNHRPADRHCTYANPVRLRYGVPQRGAYGCAADHSAD